MRVSNGNHVARISDGGVTDGRILESQPSPAARSFTVECVAAQVTQGRIRPAVRTEIKQSDPTIGRTMKHSLRPRGPNIRGDHRAPRSARENKSSGPSPPYHITRIIAVLVHIHR